MIPKINAYATPLEEVTMPTNTFKIVHDKRRINGDINGREALKQAIYLILSTERYKHPIYTWQYGVELLDVIGLDPILAIPEIKTRITEALIQDDRILSVDNFEFTRNKKIVHVKFVISTIYGDVNFESDINHIVSDSTDIGGSDVPLYDGSYYFKSSSEPQTVYTKNKRLIDNILIDGMPITTFENDGGGTTVVIG